MKKLLAIGEALIDFIPQQIGCRLSEVQAFAPKVGGAPANVCGAYVRLGGAANLITQLGDDPFGDKIVNEFSGFGIGTDYICRTTQANTSLAFVSLAADGNREFSFYRKPGADMLLEPSQIENGWFDDAFALHFCSVSLGDFPMKQAHEKAIFCAKQAGALISFDVNLRLPLWADHDALRETVRTFCPQAHILKISDEELSFITGCTQIEDALPQLFTGCTELVLYTCGKDGAYAFTRSASASHGGVPVQPIDTTGAGDAFIGSLLYQLAVDGHTAATLPQLDAATLERYLAFSNRYCSISVQACGAIDSYPTMEQMR